MTTKKLLWQGAYGAVLIGLIVVLIVLLNTRCLQPGTGTEGEGIEGAAMLIAINGGDLAKSIYPPIPIAITSYEVHGDGPSGQVFDVTVGPGGSELVDGLKEGSWTVTALAKQEGGITLAEGGNTVPVVVGVITPCPITCVEYAGIGGMDIVTNWSPTGLVAGPVVQSELKLSDGTETDISAEWVMGSDTAQYANAALDNGWYGLVFRVFSEGSPEPSGGWATLVRILKDYTTTGVVDFTVNEVFGGLEVLIDLDMYEDLGLTLSHPEGDIGVYIGTTENVSITPDEAALIFYYVNGVQVAAAAAFDVVGDTYEEGFSYNLNALAFSLDGKKAAMASWQIVKSDVPPGSLSGVVNSDQAGLTNVYIYGPTQATLITTFAFVAVPGVPYPFSFDLGLVPQVYLKGLLDVLGSTQWWWINDTQSTNVAANAQPISLPDLDVGFRIY